MKFRISLFLFLLIVLIIDDVNAGRIGSSRIGSSRFSPGGFFSSRSRGSSSGSRHGGSGSSSYGHSSSPGRQTSSSSQFGHGSSSGGHVTGSSPFGSPPSRHTTGSGPVAHGNSPSQTSHQQNKDASNSFLHAEGGGATRPPQTNSAQPSFGRPSAPHGNTGTHPGSQPGKPGFTTDNKQNSAPHNPSAPSADHLSKSTAVPSQNHAPTSFGQPSAPFNPSHEATPHNAPPWSNPHYNSRQPHPPGPTSTNVGFKDHLRPTSMPVPSSHVPSAPYPPPPYTPYPMPNSNQRPPPYPGHPSFPAHSNQPHSTYNPSHPLPGQIPGHPPSYSAHVPPPMSGTFGNPYSTQPVGGAYVPTGRSYYPQQHVLAQPAAQPYIPGQTIIMVPGQQDSGRGFGQLVKEALVFSTVNAGVHSLLHPHHHHHHFTSDSRPASSSTTTSETHITYNNHYFNGAPGSNVPPVPASPGTSQGSVAYPGNYPNPVNNPAITPGVSIPTIAANNGSNVNPIGAGSAATTNDMANPPAVNPGSMTNNGQGAASDRWATTLPRYRISDDELRSLSEELFAKQEVDISKYITLHLQRTAKSPNITDEAKGPLIYVQDEAYNYPTILVIRALYDNYEHNSTVKENRTLAERKEENLLLDVFLNTNVMARAMQWLSERGFIDPDDFEKKDTLRHIWFSQFDGVTSGFERVFTSERYGSELLGAQDWIYFDYQESRRHIDYMGYVDTLKLGNNASLLKLNFQMDDIIRPNATIFVGVLPELEMSLYTICFYARPNDLCPVSLGGSKFNIYTHAFRYYGKDLIDLALPIF